MRHPNVMRPVKLTTTLPEDIRARLDLHLFSEVEKKVPQGAYQQFFLERIREFFDQRSFDTGFGVVRGSAETISKLESVLETTDGR